MIGNKVQEHWNEVNIGYSAAWAHKARQELSKKELDFIAGYIINGALKRLLDIGIGNGRVLDAIIRNSLTYAAVYGIDIAEEMIAICKRKFENEDKVKELKVCNISLEDLSIDGRFDFITAIRVLKYSENWPDIIAKIYQKLNSGGLFIFTMPNNYSISGLYKEKYSKHKLPMYYTDRKRLLTIAEAAGFQVLDIRGFARLPEKFYFLSDRNLYVSSLFSFEKILEFCLGKSFLSRVLFVVCTKA